MNVERRTSNAERRRARRWVERSVRGSIFLLALVPLVRIAVQGFTGGLGGNPIEEMLHRTGWWALAFLILTLSVTPARRLTRIGWLVKLRRMLGLYAFFYATVHFAVYVGVDQFFAWDYILEDIGERPYITVGFTALLILAPLAATSTKRMIKRLGGRRWNRLHRLVYIAAALGVLHFLWLVKADIREPVIFGAILATLLGYRLAAGPYKRLARLKWFGNSRLSIREAEEQGR
ncbi:MAG: sulfoxide reductase heme-binding subunit YedZ [Gemmatimonadota bacterium]|nr:MAG: sulfoxide reductase heme-binding subunit YedZ [Gemmatimonadota bacterium]